MCTADKEMNMEAILLVMYTTYAVVKIGPKKNSAVVKIRFKSRTGLNFFKPYFLFCLRSVNTARIAFLFISLSAVHLYDFHIIYGHLFMTSRVYLQLEPT